MRYTPKRPRNKLDRSSYQQLWKQVLERDGWRCQACGGRMQLQVHHLREAEPGWRRRGKRPRHINAEM